MNSMTGFHNKHGSGDILHEFYNQLDTTLSSEVFLHRDDDTYFEAADNDLITEIVEAPCPGSDSS